MTIFLLVLLAAVTRLLPHVDNASAITAVGILSGFLLPKKQAFIVPLAARLVSDILIGFFAWQMMFAVYGAHLVGVLLGFWIKQSSLAPVQWIKIVVSGVAASVVFFLVTNFAFLYPTYAHSFSGIILAYQNGLPFYRGTLLGDAGYTVGIFAVYFAAVKTVQSTWEKKIFSKT